MRDIYCSTLDQRTISNVILPNYSKIPLVNSKEKCFGYMMASGEYVLLAQLDDDSVVKTVINFINMTITAEINPVYDIIEHSITLNTGEYYYSQLHVAVNDRTTLKFNYIGVAVAGIELNFDELMKYNSLNLLNITETNFDTEVITMNPIIDDVDMLLQIMSSISDDEYIRIFNTSTVMNNSTKVILSDTDIESMILDRFESSGMLMSGKYRQLFINLNGTIKLISEYKGDMHENDIIGMYDMLKSGLI